MSQRFLLSPAAKTLSLVKVMRMSDEEARGVPLNPLGHNRW